ncbi:MAG: RNA-binding S4 domain-containing protein [Opitutales bacterium]
MASQGVPGQVTLGIITAASPTTPPSPDRIRADKWLWAVRFFKSRSLAAKACRKNRVRLLGGPETETPLAFDQGTGIKPSRDLTAGDWLGVDCRDRIFIVRVLQCLGRRVGAPVARLAMEDHTPPEPEQTDPASQLRQAAPPKRARGAGRPTKRERRTLEAWLRGDDDGWP